MSTLTEGGDVDKTLNVLAGAAVVPILAHTLYDTFNSNPVGQTNQPLKVPFFTVKLELEEPTEAIVLQSEFVS